MEPIGTYEGTDKTGKAYVIPRYVDPAVTGTRLAADFPVVFDVSVPDDSMPSSEFDAMLERTVPADVLARIDGVIVDATTLAAEQKADSPPLSPTEWRRGIMVSWLHSRDLQVLMAALGHPKAVLGVHDIEEFALGKRLKEKLNSAAPWYVAYVQALSDDDPVNVGFFNPNISASMYKWGDAKTGVQNAMDAHRLAAHHDGTPESPQDWVERAANFVVHHIPREHMGIRHEPRGSWSKLEPSLAEDPAMKDASIGKVIARDVAALAQLLEREGKVNPWQLLAVPVDAPPTISQMEHALLVASASPVVAKALTTAAAALSAPPDLQSVITTLSQFDRGVQAIASAHPAAAATLRARHAALPR